jgi:hypothetical protein
MRLSVFFVACVYVISLLANTSTARAQTPQPVLPPKIDNAANSDAITKAGQSLALTQRLLKLHTQMVVGVNTSRSQTTLLEVISGFEANLAELENYVTTVSTINRTRQLSASWQTFKASLLATPNKAKLKQLATEADGLMEMAEYLQQSYQSQSKTPRSTLIDRCDRQRLISQRLAALFMLEEAGQISLLQAAEQAKLRDEFAANLALLTSASVNTAEINSELKLATQQWQFFQTALTAKHGLEAARHVATTSERVLEVLNNATAMYHRVVASGVKAPR